MGHYRDGKYVSDDPMERDDSGYFANRQREALTQAQLEAEKIGTLYAEQLAQLTRLRTVLAAANQRAATAEAEAAVMRLHLEAVIANIADYERTNNLAPNPGRKHSWDSVANATFALSQASSRFAALMAVVEAARELDALEDFGEPIGPGQDPADWDAYNAARRKVYDALQVLTHPQGEAG